MAAARRPSALLAGSALVLGGLPATVAAIVLLPWVLLGALFPPAAAPWRGLLGLPVAAACLWALGSDWVLAVRNWRGRACVTGPGLVGGAASALAAAIVVGLHLPPAAAALVLVPFAVGLGLCAVLQRAIRRSQAPAVAPPP